MISGSQRNSGPQFRHFLTRRNLFYMTSSKTIPAEAQVEQSCAKTQVLHNSFQRQQKTRISPQPRAQTHNCVLDWLVQCGIILIRRVRSHRDSDLPFHRDILGYRHVCQTWELKGYKPLGGEHFRRVGDGHSRTEFRDTTSKRFCSRARLSLP